ncbi:MAG: N-acetyltransferase [Chloroflexi bacterium]|nr:MAG: N-acetyltransferase [Chloroflexota bacterium]
MDERNWLVGERVRLTAVSPDDVSVIARWYEDVRFGRLADATPATPKTAEQLRKWVTQANESPNNFLFGIRLIDTNTMIGFVELDGILWTHGVTSLGIGLGDEENWGQGYGREAMILALQFAFRELNLHRVQLTVFAYNTRATRLYESLGFVREGVLREFLLRDGKRFDMYQYGMLYSEWVRQPYATLSDGTD